MKKPGPQTMIAIMRRLGPSLVRLLLDSVRVLLKVAIAVMLAVFVLYFFAPLLNGYHFGCNVLAGDTERTIRLGVQFCKASSPPSSPPASDPGAGP